MLTALTDRELVSWAIKNGWKYFSFNDQLRDPQGFLTTANNWSNIGEACRKKIIEQMSRQAEKEATC